MNEKIKKMMVIALVFVISLFSLNFTYARYEEGTIVGGTSGTSSSTNWWGDAYNFFNGSTTNRYDVSALEEIQDLISFVGNMIFFIVTVVLGVKYIWGGVESKASVKDSLITLVIAALFFYGWSTIRALFVGSNGLVFMSNEYETTAQAIYSTILYICNFLAVGGIIYIGIRYMMAGAEGKAQLKAKGVPIVLGIVMVYATLTFLTFIVNTLTVI